MKKIKLPIDRVVLVDDEDFEYLNQFKWGSTSQGFAARNEKMPNGKYKSITMHRQIMNTPKGLEVDHWDHDPRNNQRNNLRNCTHKENCQNSYSKYLQRIKDQTNNGKTFDELITK